MTDTFIQAWSQALGGSGYAVAFVLAMAAVTALAVMGFAVCAVEAWQERKVLEQRRQRELERSVRRARRAA